jgi:ATP-dependent Lon protease
MVFSKEKRRELIDAILEAQDENDIELELIEDDEDDEDDIDFLQNAYEDGNVVLPTIALRGLAVLPGMIMHFDIGREKSVKALETAMASNQFVFLLAQKSEAVENPDVKDLYEVGTVAKVRQMLKMPGDSIRVLVDCIERAKLLNMIQDEPYFKAEVLVMFNKEYPEEVPTIEALKRSVKSNFIKYDDLADVGGPAAVAAIESPEHPGVLADAIAGHMDIKVESKQKILETIDFEERLRALNEILAEEINILSLEADIKSKVKDQLDKNQKEYYLREQMRAIQDELGVAEDLDDEIERWHKQMKKLKLPKEVAQKVEKEIIKLTKMQSSSAEGNVIRTYVDSILELPWNKSTKTQYDLNEARKILDSDHYGLNEVKERVLEYLAVIQLSGAIKGPILCLVGPPGVGKTSVAKSIAHSIGREFVHMSLGGVRDEAEIRGHRRTYIGAIPGRIMNCIKEAKTNNPVFLFDEVDKIGADFKGDPASALLEVLDPEQNKEFVDHYLEVPFDLSKVMFITTANDTDTIPRPLLDRMEVIEVPGYTEEEKVKIAQRYLVPKQIKENGLTPENITFNEGAIRQLIEYYTRESGVRNLEREIANICRKTALKTVTTKKKFYRITEGTVEKLLGKKKYHFDIIEGKYEIGKTTGLAWTIVGGDTLFIETAIMPGGGNLVLTGQLGDVMQESAKAAISYIRSAADNLPCGLKIKDEYKEFYKDKDFHIHVPEGATPKDGPSAGVTICMSILSTLTGRPARQDIAMTGEITLLGKILPVGGIREKVLAAYRAGIRKVMLPKENERDIEDIPANVRKKIEFVLLSEAAEAIPHVLQEKEEK